MFSLRTACWATMALLSSVPLAAAQDRFLPRAAIDAYLSGLSHFGGSGAALVARGGRVLYSRGFGWADRARRIPMSSQTGVDIASMSTDLTEIAILQLRERGLLALSDSLAMYFDSVPADKRGITITQLLMHRSGLPQYFIDGNDFTHVTRAQALDSIFSRPLEFAPGSDDGYSDAGYVLLALLLERRTGTSLEAFLAREQYGPAGIIHTASYGTDALRRRAASTAHGYLGFKDAGSPTGYVRDSAYWVVKGAGGIVSTVEDVAKWEAALRGGKFIGQAGITRLLGHGVSDTSGLAGPPTALPSGKRGWIRTGSQDFGFSAGAIRYADDSTVVVVAINRQPEGMDIAYPRTRLLMALDGFLMGMPPAMPPAGLTRAVAGRAIVGTYQFADGSRVQVTRDAENFIVTPDGPLAVELLSYPIDTVGRAQRLALASRATGILTALCRGDSELLRAALARPSDRIEAYLKKTACADSVTAIRAIGTVPHWWGQTPVDAPATLLEIASRSGTTRMRFEWDGPHIGAVGGGGITAPIVRFASTAIPGEYQGFHLGIGASVWLGWKGTSAARDHLRMGSRADPRWVAHRVKPGH